MAQTEHNPETIEQRDLEHSLDQAPRDVAEMAVLYDVATALAAAADLDEMLEAVPDQVHGVLDYDVACVLLAVAHCQALQIQAAIGMGAEDLVGVEFPLDQGINGWIYREAKPVLVEDADSDPRRLHIEGRTELVRAAVGAPLIANGVPIIVQDQVLGVIVSQSYGPYAFTNRQLRFLSAIANQAGIGLQNARLYRAMQDMHRNVAYERDKLARLHRVIADVQRVDVLAAKLRLIARGVRDLGWGRVWASLLDSDLKATEFVCEGYAPREEAVLCASLQSASAWQQRLTEQLERFRLGQCYFFPWRDAWVQEQMQATKSWLSGAEKLDAQLVEALPAEAWHPRDILLVPLCGRDGKTIGIIGLDDPRDGLRPTIQRLHPIELFAQQAALTIENALLLDELLLVNTDLREMVDAQAHLLQAIEEMSPALNLDKGREILHRLTGGMREHV